MLVSDYNFLLPNELIAQRPPENRGDTRLLILERSSKKLVHTHFSAFPGLLKEGDLLVFNDSKVIPARIFGVNQETGGKFELLLLEEIKVNEWWVMMRPAKRARPNTVIHLLDHHGKILPL